MTLNLKTRLLPAALPVLVLGAAMSVAAQPKGETGMVVNPTIEECKRGWQPNDETRWSKVQFDQFCAVLRAPSQLVVNPTIEECRVGWQDGVRWSRKEFDEFCTTLRTSK